MAAYFKLEIFTPYRLFFAEDVEYVILKLYDGDAAIFAGHSLFTAPVETSIIKIKTKKGEVKYALIAKGIIEVKRNKTVLLVNSANFPEEINLERAKAAKKEAEETLAGTVFKLTNAITREKLKRAELRLKMADKKLEN